MERTVNSLEWHVEQILTGLGQDVKREGLLDTPERYIKFLKEFLSPKAFSFTTFSDESDDDEHENSGDMIVQRNIVFFSMCEHHLAPFFGTAAIGYIPNGRIVGLSKLARCVDFYANNFQNQERITNQVCERLQTELDAKGVIVTLRARHLCMSMRGVKKDCAETITTKKTGCFITEERLVNDFLLKIR